MMYCVCCGSDTLEQVGGVSVQLVALWWVGLGIMWLSVEGIKLMMF